MWMVVRSFAALVIMLVLMPTFAATAPVPNHLNSVSVLAAGVGSSLAVRTSAVAVLVATTAADPRTAVIEFVGIAGDWRNMRVSGRPGIISYIAIDTTGSVTGPMVTRIRVSLTTNYRHRLRTSGNLVYIDFQPTGEERPHPRPQPESRIPRTPAVTPTAHAARESRGVQEFALDNSIVTDNPSPTLSAGHAKALTSWSVMTEPVKHLLRVPSAVPERASEWIPVVLKDGTTIYSYGSYAEVDEKSIVSLPFAVDSAPPMELVSLASSTIDRRATIAAAESLAAARYASSDGPGDFATLSREVSADLDAVPAQSDPVVRVRIVENVIQRLTVWPRTHHGYRAFEANDAINTLQVILNELRSAAGMNHVTLTLRAPTVSPTGMVAVRQPTLIELIDIAMRVVRFLSTPAERTAVLRASAEALRRHRTELPALWTASSARRVAEALETERHVDDAYRKFTVDVVKRGTLAGRQGDVREVAKLQSRLLETDRVLGGKRDEMIASIMAALQTQFETAARVQLERDRDKLYNESARTCFRQIAAAAERFRDLQPTLQRIATSSTVPSSMQQHDAVQSVNRTLSQCDPPPLLVEAHGLMLNAAHLAQAALPGPALSISLDTSTSVRMRAAAGSVTMFRRGSLAFEDVKRTYSSR
jgi:hypothetical protein